ncbi:vesicle-associated membrane protein 7-like isoform X1 [Limulus polyphemus]|uniref:Vesicle-associated membrane protein 7 n=2 Tax=Limulus polyphemus TaxID=6850 RepID=A0ABM1T243_LIMPO|nr:vesicle-associated membrane protein 7-like isoform X1 [Limulus polyphemus]
MCSFLSSAHTNNFLLNIALTEMSGIRYACIARGSVILVSHQKASGDFENVAHVMLPNIPIAKDTKTTYTSENYLFHVVVENGLIFLCTAPPDFGRRLCYSFLSEVKRRFNTNSLMARAKSAITHELGRDFGPILAEEMERYSRGESGDNISQLQSQVEQVKGIMTQNIEKVLERGDQIDVLLDKTSDLEASSSHFRSSARRVRQKMFCQNVKMWLILGFIGVVVITLIVLMATNVIPVKKS